MLSVVLASAMLPAAAVRAPPAEGGPDEKGFCASYATSYASAPRRSRRCGTHACHVYDRGAPRGWTPLGADPSSPQASGPS